MGLGSTRKLAQRPAIKTRTKPIMVANDEEESMLYGLLVLGLVRFVMVSSIVLQIECMANVVCDGPLLWQMLFLKIKNKL